MTQIPANVSVTAYVNTNSHIMWIFIIKLTTITAITMAMDLTKVESNARCVAVAIYLVHTISFPGKWNPNHLAVRLAVRPPLGTPSPMPEHFPAERDEHVSDRRPAACVECRPCARMSRKSLMLQMVHSPFVESIALTCRCAACRMAVLPSIQSFGSWTDRRCKRPNRRQQIKNTTTEWSLSAASPSETTTNNLEVWSRWRELGFYKYSIKSDCRLPQIYERHEQEKQWRNDGRIETNLFA